MKLQKCFQDKIDVNKILLILCVEFIVFLYSCKESEKEQKIVGNWYSFINQTVYEEILITDSTYQTFHEHLELTTPYKYLIRNDSVLFYNFNGVRWISIDYKPKLIIIDDNAFLLEFQNNYRYYKKNIINEKGIIINNILDDSTYYTYLQHFYRRRMKKLFEVGLAKDTVLDNLDFWESSLPIDSLSIEQLESKWDHKND